MPLCCCLLLRVGAAETGEGQETLAAVAGAAACAAAAAVAAADADADAKRQMGDPSTKEEASKEPVSLLRSQLLLKAPGTAGAVAAAAAGAAVAL